MAEDEELQKIRKLARSGKLKAAPQQRTKTLGPQIREILDAIGIGAAWTTDESCICDFPVDEAECSILSVRLGVEVALDDYVVDIAQRLKERSGA